MRSIAITASGVSRLIVNGQRIGSGMRLPTTSKIQYARMWPREVFDCLVVDEKPRKQAMAKGLEILTKPGVYILYRDDLPYYIGQASRLRSRLWQHANVPGARYHNFWNFFSVFVAED